MLSHYIAKSILVTAHLLKNGKGDLNPICLTLQAAGLPTRPWQPTFNFFVKILLLCNSAIIKNQSLSRHRHTTPDIQKYSLLLLGYEK
jgi:hypothetical protein